MANDPFSLTSLYEGSRGARIVDAILITVLSFVVLAAPLPFGSVEYWAIALLQTIAAICLLLWVIKLTFCADSTALQEFRDQAREYRTSLARAPFFHRHYRIAESIRFMTFGKWPRKNESPDLVATKPVPVEVFPYFSVFGYPIIKTGVEILAIIFLALVAVQMIPWPASLHAYFSPHESDLYITAANVAGSSTQGARPFSVSPFHTVSKLMEYGAYFFIYLVVVNTVRTRRLFWILIIAIFISATFQSIYGMYEYLSGHQQIFTYKKRSAYDAASGTFINRNHFAVYLAMSMPFVLAVILEKSASFKKLGRNFLIRLVRMVETHGSILLFLVMAALILAGLIFSMSRGGIVFAVISNLILFILYSHKIRRRKVSLPLAVFFGVLLGFGLWLGSGSLLARFAKISQEFTGASSRLQLWKDTLQIFMHFPVVGTGAGTFEQIFPMYRTSVYEYHFAHAHNDYLQMLAENGISMLFLILFSFALLFHRLGIVLARKFRRLTLLQLGAFCSLLTLALHSIFDFSLQIPALAAHASVIAGLFYTSYHATE